MTSFIVVFGKKVGRDRRLDIIQAIREFPWWQETDYGQSNSLHHVRIIVSDAGQLTAAKETVAKMNGVATVKEFHGCHGSCNGNACVQKSCPPRTSCLDPFTWVKSQK